MVENVNLSELQAGDNHYKAYVGPPLKYDLVGAMQFNLLTSFGLRDHHKLLDIGCGSLRSGKLMIPFLQKGNYFGVEPNQWLIDEGIKHEIGKELIAIKSPSFNNSANFEFGSFNCSFDFLIAQSIFSHAAAAQITTCMREAKKVMQAEALFLATFVMGEENYAGEDWVYPGCVTYTDAYILELIRAEKLDAIQTKWLHPNGQTWYVIFHPEQREAVEKTVKNVFNVNKIQTSVLDEMKKQPLIYNKFTRYILQKLKGH